MLEHVQSDLSAIVSALPRPVLHQEIMSNDWLAWPVGTDESAVLANLRTQTKGCPACMLAALRQAKIPVPMLSGFDYTAEMKAVWQQVNEDREYGDRDANDYASWAITQVPDSLRE